MEKKKIRIESVDALRGFAVMAIMLLHNIEHFNFYRFPEPGAAWLQTLDTWIWNILFFLFSGKAYAIFALLFGFSFFIQDDNQLKKGKDFRLRFLWRLFLLFLIGNFNGAFFPGDILVLYSIIGVVLVLTCRMNDIAVLVIAVLLMLQPLEIAKFIHALINPDHVPQPELWKEYNRAMYPALAVSEFWPMVKSNLWNGQMFSLLWAWSYGRFFQTASLFLLGMLLGRRRLFADAGEHLKFWRGALVTGAVAFIPLYLLADALPELLSGHALTPADTVVSSFRNFAFMTVLVSSFILLWQTGRGHKVLSVFAPYGKMSLTNYLVQSIAGSFLYFGYGLSLYDDLGTSGSFALGLALFVLQLILCRLWLKRFSHGPFEWIWKKATWIFS